VNALIQFAERHPGFSGVVGTTAGVGPTVAQALHLVAGVASDIAVIAGCLTAIVTFIVVFRKWRRDVRIEAAQRAFLERLEKHPGEDEIP
jgi:cytochrome c oxidase assembly factor CtaG